MADCLDVGNIQIKIIFKILKVSLQSEVGRGALLIVKCGLIFNRQFRKNILGKIEKLSSSADWNKFDFRILLIDLFSCA